jgi:hypothetical protein
MNRLALLLVPTTLFGVAVAQKVDLTVEPAKNQAQRYSIQTKIQSNTKTLVNGEEPPQGKGGFGGGGGGESSVSQEVVFDEGPADAGWRQYRKLTSTETRQGQDPRETKGGLEGKKVNLKTGENGGVALTEGEGDQAKPVDAALSSGIPGRMSLVGFVPGKAVAVGEEFDLSKNFASALRGVVHPVIPEPAAGGAQGGRGQGGGKGQGGQGRGQGGMGRGGFGAGGTISQLIAGGKLNAAVTGKVTSVEKVDGQDMAVITITGKLTGKGTGPELGLQGFGGGRGRGGQGGGQGGGAQAPAGTDKADATFDINGKVRVNLTTHQVAAVELDGNVAVKRDTSMTRQDQQSEISSDTKGKFQLAVHCEPAKPDAKDSKDSKDSKDK